MKNERFVFNDGLLDQNPNNALPRVFREYDKEKRTRRYNTFEIHKLREGQVMVSEFVDFEDPMALKIHRYVFYQCKMPGSFVDSVTLEMNMAVPNTPEGEIDLNDIEPVISRNITVTSNKYGDYRYDETGIRSPEPVSFLGNSRKSKRLVKLGFPDEPPKEIDFNGTWEKVKKAAKMGQMVYPSVVVPINK